MQYFFTVAFSASWLTDGVIKTRRKEAYSDCVYRYQFFLINEDEKNVLLDSLNINPSTLR